jgi:hypothetical protein
MKIIEAQQGEWSRLFEVTLRIRQLAPWEWMNETDIFGVQHPETGAIGFVSVMGALGEHIAVSLYLGASALAKFMYLQEVPPEVFQEYPEMLLEIPQLQASFEDRGVLDDWDRQLIRNLSLKFRGRKAWPRFQSFRPGFMPWRLEPDEILFLALALEQLEQVAPRAHEDRSFLRGEDTRTFFLRACHMKEGKTGEWEDRYVRIPPPEFPPVQIAWDARDVKKLKSTVSQGDIIELDFFQYPGAIGKQDERPQAGYILLALHAQSNLIFGVETLQATESIEHMWGQIPGLLLHRLAGPEMRPKEIHVQSQRLVNVLQPAFKELGTRIVLKPSLKKLRAAKREMFAFFEKGPSPFRG